MAIAVNIMGCGLDTRPAALACLRIIIAALNILIAVSFLHSIYDFINRVPINMFFLYSPWENIAEIEYGVPRILQGI